MVARLEQTLVEALEPAAKQDRARPGGEVAHAPLRQCAAPAWRERDRWSRVRDAVERRRDHIGAQHHARTSPGRGVIDRPVPIGREVADLHGIERPPALGQRPAGERLT